MRIAPIAAAIVLAVSPTTAGRAETLISKSYQYFNIGGRTAGDLDRELSRNGPQASGTEMRHPGATQMKFSGTISYQQLSGGRCKVKSAQIKLHTKLILPRWTNRRRADHDVALIWDTLSRDIKRHEERHAEIARQYARKLEKALVGLYPRRSCKAMEAAANKESDKVLKKHDKAQMAFDRAESASFERRMTRMLQFKLDKMKE
ncbi:MAG: peptidase [Rhizobiales bacterium]|nr:peptidase [Hyphomicrobiales bacterium]MBA70132.1 peptidase [Hyphomicrobiales bacterium]|tara:strand:+ start:438 stop:1049 length:612 start_codon:yes stop_codon:yes gene_type:complete